MFLNFHIYLFFSDPLNPPKGDISAPPNVFLFFLLSFGEVGRGFQQKRPPLQAAFLQIFY
jgi:hypothetical protein